MKLSRTVARLASIVLSAAVLAGCSSGGEGAPAPIAPLPAPGAHSLVGSFVLKVRPGQHLAELVRLPPELFAADGVPLVQPENLDALPIVADGVTGSGPSYTVELSTPPSSIIDTYGTGATGGCPADGFCADVTFMHFYPGIDLSAVYVQVYAITDTNGNALGGHGPTNGVASTPFGLDLSFGAWQYTALPGSLAPSTGSTLNWQFANPDDASTNIYLNAVAAVYPMLWFDTSAITQTASLVAGQPAILHYVYARNTACRGTGWSMQGYLKGYNIDIHTTSWTGDATDTYFDQHVVMPFAPGLDFWFNNTDSTGCNVYDSNGGNNFNYGITGTYPALYFTGPNSNISPYWTASWGHGQESGVGGGATITVDYELDRVLCGSLDQYGRVPTGTTATMYYSLDGGSFTAASLLGLPYDVPSSLDGSAGQVFVPPIIAIPSGSHSMTVYFDSTDPGGCHNYDSSAGANFAFSY
jgi:hypothetical protein